MATPKPDMFSSDLVFIQVVSAVLMVLGGGLLLFILSSRLFGWEWLSWEWVPIFGGYDIYQRELAAINLPLAMLILGIGLRLYTPFGWVTCLLVLLMLLGQFVLIGWRLTYKLEDYRNEVVQNPEQAQEHPLFESLAVDLGLSVLVFIFVAYLLLPQVRRMYWRKSQQGDSKIG